MTLGKRIRAWRTNWYPTLTQAEIASGIGVSTQTIWLWEDDRTEPTHDHLAAFCKLRGISLSTFWAVAPEAAA